MNSQTLQIKAKIQIQKPVGDVYEAIVEPEKMANYFISEGSGRLETGNEVIWKFPEFDMDVPIRVDKTETDKYVSYYWDVNDKAHLVEIQLMPVENGGTLVTVSEKEESNTEEGIQWLMGNTEGWANFLACLKAYLEYGINLRKGAFDFLNGQSG